jgi:hypothetical protein
MNKISLHFLPYQFLLPQAIFIFFILQLASSHSWHTQLIMLVLYTIYKKETVWSFCFHLLSLTEYSFIHIEVQELFHITVEELFLSMASTSRNEKKDGGAKYIPEVIAFSILSKLPLKSLKRFSCASKS